MDNIKYAEEALLTAMSDYSAVCLLPDVFRENLDVLIAAVRADERKETLKFMLQQLSERAK